MSSQSKFTKISNSVLDLILPKRCIGCGTEGDLLCHSCRNSLPRPAKASTKRNFGSLSALDGLYSVLLHQGLAREAVHQLKYRNLKVLSKPLAEVMADYLRYNRLPVDTITAVPVHPKRLRSRGYNQAELLAKEVSHLIQLPLVRGSLTQFRNIPSQVSLRASERSANVEGAFRCKDRAFQGNNVLLIDDVCTTGATLNACAIALKEAGALSVWGLTLSRE